MNGPRFARFAEAARRSFGFLESEFGCQVEEDDELSRIVMWALLFRNEHTVVRIHADGRERWFAIDLWPIRDGVEHPDESIGLGTVVEALGDEPPRFSGIDADGLDEGLDAWALALRTHAGPMLTGEWCRAEAL